MFLTEEEIIKLKETDSKGHYHTCPKCKTDHYCPGINLGFHCADRIEDKCFSCSGKHPNAIKLFLDSRIIGCHDCGEPVDFSTWDEENRPTEIDKDKYFYNLNSCYICQKCFDISRANGTMQTVDEFFDTHQIGIKNEDGEIQPITITDRLNPTVN